MLFKDLKVGDVLTVEDIGWSDGAHRSYTLKKIHRNKYGIYQFTIGKPKSDLGESLFITYDLLAPISEKEYIIKINRGLKRLYTKSSTLIN